MLTPKRFILQQHGSFTIEIKSKTIVIHAYAAWNEQTSGQFRQAYVDAAQHLKNSPWACLINLLEWELGTGEILRVGQELNAWSYNNNQRFSAIVCDSALHRQLIEKIQEPTKSIERRYFTDMMPAKEWLHSLNLYSET